MQMRNRADAQQSSSTTVPAIQAFTSLSEVTVGHAFDSPYVSVVVYTTAGFVMSEKRIRSIQCVAGYVRIAFHAVESGVVRVGP